MALSTKEYGCNSVFVEPVVERLFIGALNERIKAITTKEFRAPYPMGNGSSLPTLLRSCVGLHLRADDKKDILNSLAPRFRWNWDTFHDAIDLEIYYWDDNECIRELCRVRWSDLTRGQDMDVICYDHVQQYMEKENFGRQISARIRAGLQDFWEITLNAVFMAEKHSHYRA